MKRVILLLALLCMVAVIPAVGQATGQHDTTTVTATADESANADSGLTVTAGDELEDAAEDAEDATSNGSLHKQLKQKFIEGSAGFMSLVALALVLGLSFCIERIIYLTLSEVNTKRLMSDIDSRLQQDDVEGAKELCRNTRGPVASICYQGLLHLREGIDDIDRQLTNYGNVQISTMEKGCTWIKLFIAVAPSLGFLGTVIGMVMAFDQIQQAGDISPTIVARGMKVALITTIFGIIVAVVLQFFYNYIVAKIERLTLKMEECAITFMDSVTQYKARNNG